jgi:phage shock protein PspC (stress-responsive transcriptional regulator)
VAGGLARHLDVDPLILRVALVVLVFFGGAGLIVYAACWLLVPEDGDDRAPFNFDDRTRSVALVLAGVIATLALVGDTMGGYGFPWPLAIIALVVLLVVVLGDRDKPKPTAPPYPSPVGYGPQTQQGWVTPTAPTGPATPTPAAYAGGPGAPAYAPVHPAPPVPPAATWQPRPPHPRKRGPVLFWFTLALSALAIGMLGIADLAGAEVADSSYPALVVGICGVMLLVGAFYGRAGGLIAVGLVAAVALAGATASGRWDDSVVRAPGSAAQVQDRYEIGGGELVLDLTRVPDLAALDGRTIEVRAGAGSVDVKLPVGLDVEVAANVGLGDAEVFGDRQDGAGVDVTGSHDGGLDAPDIRLDIELGVGEIDVNVVNPEGGTR